MSLDTLLGRQNPDGGWPYIRGGSWTEPTTYAVLALLATEDMAGAREAAQRGLNWLAACARPDGGWPPQAGIAQSTWVTALVALLPRQRIGDVRCAQAIRWLASTEGEESTPIYRFREWLLGHTREPEERFPGWPWVPGAAAWVTPTALAILALEKEVRRRADAELRERISQGRGFLLARMCREGGWNHGSVRPLGYESRPYPETTGMALVALRGVRGPQLDLSIEAARRFLAKTRSADAANWLRLGLMTHGALGSEALPDPAPQPRTVVEIAVDQIVASALEGRNVFVDLI